MDGSKRGIGDNRPPDEIDLLIARADELVEAADDWREIANADAAARAADFITQLREARDDLEKAERKAKGPVQAALDAIRARFRRPTDGLEAAIKHIRGLSDVFLNAERERLAQKKAEAERQAELARQEAERLAAEAERSGSLSGQLAARAAMDEVAELTEALDEIDTTPRIRGDLSGKVVSQRTVWGAEFADVKKARAYYLKDEMVLNYLDALILKHASKLATATKDPKRAPPGIRFVTKTKA